MAGLFDSIFIASLWGGGFTVAFLLVNKLFKAKLPLSWHYYVWFVVLLRLLVPAFITVNVEPKQVPVIYAGQEATLTETGKNNAMLSDVLEDTPVFTEDTLIQVDKRAAQPEAAASPPNVLASVLKLNNLWIVWLIVAILILSYNILSYLLYANKLKASSFPPGEEEGRLFESLLLMKKVNRKVSLFRNKDAQTPFVIGLRSPKVIIPDKDYTPAQLGHIFSHELNHIASYDVAVKWLFEIAKAIHWFNPLVYFASRNASFYCEALCDQRVLKNCDADGRKEYGLTIVEIISQAVSPKTQMCIPMSSNKSDLKERMRYILDSGKNKKSVLLAAALVVVTLALCAFSSVQYKEIIKPAPETLGATASVQYEEAAGFPQENNTPVVKKFVEKSTNFLIVGMDSYVSADVIIIANFNTETGNIKLLSIPRDTYLPLSNEIKSKLGQQGDYAPMEKLSVLMAYAGKENGLEYLQSEISKLLGIQIDYYVKMDMSAFEKIVDAAGGVEMEIRGGGLFYSDPEQDLEIALQGGMQHLDGDRALQLVRYRADYAMGDLDRIDMQQQFLKVLFQKVVSTDNLLEKASALLSILVQDTETNFTLSDFTSYTLYIPKINADSLQVFTVPAEAKRIGTYSYMFMDNEEYENSVAEYFR